MAFQQAESVSPTGRGAMAISFYIPDPEIEDETQSGSLAVQIRYSDGSIQERKFDLLARLQDDATGQGHLANLASLRDYIVARVESEVLGL
jgi:hypothetical protein